jgi:hypothetical protein
MKNFIVFGVVMSLVFYMFGYFLYEAAVDIKYGLGSPFLPQIGIMADLLKGVSTLFYPLPIFIKFFGKEFISYGFLIFYYVVIAVPIYFINRSLSKTWNKYVEMNRFDKNRS